MMRSIAPRARTTCAAARRALATFDDPRALYKDYEQEPAVVADHDHARTGLSRVPYHLRRGLILPNHVSGMDVLHTPLCVACLRSPLLHPSPLPTGTTKAPPSLRGSGTGSGCAGCCRRG